MIFSLIFALVAQALSQPTLAALDTNSAHEFIRAPKTGGDSGAVRKEPNVLGIDVRAESVYIEDVKTGAVLLEKNADVPRSLASITKLMTALVFLDQSVPWEREVVIEDSDRREGGRLYVSSGEQITVSDLFMASLTNSANNATAALVRVTGLSEEEFVQKMNEKASALGLFSAFFVEPTGLDSANRASARDVVHLAQYAFADQNIRRALQAWRYRITVLSFDGAMKRTIQIKNTNYLLDSFLNREPYTFIGGKTGFIDEAGWCLVGEVAGPNGRQVRAVVLGAPTHDARFEELKKALWWAFEFYE